MLAADLKDKLNIRLSQIPAVVPLVAMPSLHIFGTLKSVKSNLHICVKCVSGLSLAALEILQSFFINWTNYE